MKKLISILLILATVLSCFMLTVSADDMIVSDEGRLPFEDVKSNHWFYQSVSFCYANGIIKGMNEYTFGWNGNLTRAQFLTMLAIIDGADLSQYSVTKFEDVKSTHWYYGAVAWAYETELTSGLTETKFGPNQAITRAQIARFMWIYMKDKYTVEVDENCLEQFVDVSKVPMWAQDGMKYVVSAGLISGMQKNDKLFVAPNDMTTRAQTAVIFKNATEQYFCGECEHNFSEADCTNAAACEKCGLVNGLPNGHTLTAYDCVTGGKCSVCEAEVEPSKTIHDFAPATCTAPITCTRCHATRGEALGHKWNAATCTAPKTCSVCKATEGSAKGHNWRAATCTEPKVCVVCNVKEGSALGHTTTTGTCGRCGKVFSVSDFDKMVNLLKSKGKYDSNSGSYELIIEDSDSQTILSYYVLEECIDITNFRSYGNGVIDATEIWIFKNDKVYEYLYVYAFTDEPFFGYGILDPATFTKSTKEGFSEYEGTLKSSYTDYMNSALKEILSDVNKILAPYGYSVKQLGFKVY